MKYKKTKIITVIAVFSALCVLLCTFCSASWSAANAFNTGGTQTAKNVYFRNHLDLHLVSQNSTETRTYYGDVYIEDLGNTYLNPLEYYNTSAQSSEMETMFGLTFLNAETDQVGYSYYQSSLQNVNLDNYGGTAGEYTGVGMTCYGFPFYNYTDIHYYIKTLIARDYLQHLHTSSFGGQNIRIFFPSEASYYSLYNSISGTDGKEKNFYAQHSYNIYGYNYGADGALYPKNKEFTYTYGITLPSSYTSLTKMVEPTSNISMPYINIFINAPLSAFKAFCEREFDVYSRGGYVQVDRHSIEFLEISGAGSGTSSAEIDLAGKILGVLDNKVSTVSSLYAERHAYNGELASEHKLAIEDIDFGTWIGNAVQGFFNVEILPSISFLDIFVSGIGVLLLVAFLRMFAGG